MPDRSSPPAAAALSSRTILRFWSPLAATWLMMAAEGPFLAAVIARLPDPKLNLAAYGVALAFAILVESPVIMLMGATTALLEDEPSYRRLRNFAFWLNGFATALLLALLWPPVRDLVFLRVLALPPGVAHLATGALWCFLPWPWAIGYRRFLQGVMIRADRTRLVAYGTVIRLGSMASAALVYGIGFDLPGAWVGALSLSTGVLVEAVTARIMAHRSIAEVRRRSPTGGTRADTGLDAVVLGYREIGAYYYPLALTSLLGLGVHPMLTFFMGRATSPVESLAVFPVVQSLLFLFRSIGLSFQDAAIALLGRGGERYREISGFAGRLGLILTALFVGLVFTPLADLWFGTVSGLSDELTSFALPAARVAAPLPFLGVWLSLQRGVFMKNRRTRPITGATLAEVVTIAAGFIAFGWGLGLVGVTAAFAAFTLGKCASNAFLLRGTRDLVRETAGAPGGGRPHG